MIRKIVPLFAGIAAVLVTIVAVGLMLPGTWEAEQTVELQASPSELFPFLADLSRWDDWTVWSEFESVVSDPSAGKGATRSWDDAEYGAGRIQLIEVLPLSLVRYRVELEGGGVWIEGEITLEERHSGTAVRWLESGDFGWNPLMGYMARRMPESQAAQLLESLERLGEAVAASRDASAGGTGKE